VISDSRKSVDADVNNKYVSLHNNIRGKAEVMLSLWLRNAFGFCYWRVVVVIIIVVIIIIIIIIGLNGVLGADSANLVFCSRGRSARPNE
jgi:hypothetical protein